MVNQPFGNSYNKDCPTRQNQHKCQILFKKKKIVAQDCRNLYRFLSDILTEVCEIELNMYLNIDLNPFRGQIIPTTLHVLHMDVVSYRSSTNGNNKTKAKNSIIFDTLNGQWNRE